MGEASEYPWNSNSQSNLSEELVTKCIKQECGWGKDLTEPWEPDSNDTGHP